MKPAHRQGTYLVDARRVVAVAAANPLTLCVRCAHPFDKHGPHHNGAPPRWTAGHTRAGNPHATPWLTPLITVAQVEDCRRGNHLAPEVSTCNYSGQASDITAQPVVTTRTW